MLLMDKGGEFMVIKMRFWNEVSRTYSVLVLSRAIRPILKAFWKETWVLSPPTPHSPKRAYYFGEHEDSGAHIWGSTL